MLLSFTLESVWPMFSSKSFIVSCLISRSLTRFEYIFVYGVRDVEYFFYCFFNLYFIEFLSDFYDFPPSDTLDFGVFFSNSFRWWVKLSN